MARILVVDDDAHLREVVRYALDRDGHAVTEAGDGLAALAQVAASSPDLVVLDVKMPELDGYEVCRRLRATSRVPILFLSTRDDEIDKVIGLDLGADDYLAKPFSPRELTSRVRAILRRTQTVVAGSPTLVVGALRLEPEAHRAWAGGGEVTLTATEFRLLHALASRPGKVFTRDELVERAYEGPHHVADRTIDSHLRNLRAKLREHGVDPIATLHGVGWRLEPSG